VLARSTTTAGTRRRRVRVRRPGRQRCRSGARRARHGPSISIKLAEVILVYVYNNCSSGALSEGQQSLFWGSDELLRLSSASPAEVTAGWVRCTGSCSWVLHGRDRQGRSAARRRAGRPNRHCATSSRLTRITVRRALADLAYAGFISNAGIGVGPSSATNPRRAEPVAGSS